MAILYAMFVAFFHPIFVIHWILSIIFFPSIFIFHFRLRVFFLGTCSRLSSFCASCREPSCVCEVPTVTGVRVPEARKSLSFGVIFGELPLPYELSVTIVIRDPAHILVISLRGLTLVIFLNVSSSIALFLFLFLRKHFVNFLELSISLFVRCML